MIPIRSGRPGPDAARLIAPRRLAASLLLLVGAALPACGEPPAPTGGAAGASWSYKVEVASALDRLHVSMRFPQGAPASLSLDDGNPAPWIVTAPRNGEGGITPAQGGAFTPAGGGADLGYDVDLGKLLAEPSDSQRIGKDVVIRVGRWLLRPNPVPPGAWASLTFELPKGVQVSTPWPGVGVDGGPGPYRLDETAFAFWGHVAFGRFDVDRSTAAGTTVDMAVLDAPRKATREGLRRWTGRALEAVAALFGGRYPRSHLQVLIRPGRHEKGDGKDPVDLGATFPGGGAVFHAWIPPGTEDKAFENDWVAVHELVHLAMPPIRPEDSWLSEGVATYYQEVLRSRAWWDDEVRGWRSLSEGLAWGRSQPGGPSLRELAQDMHRTGTFYRTYWAGAAVASIADAEVRRATENRVSLDDAMRAWAVDIGAARLFTGDELLQKADAAAGGPRFSSVYAKYLGERAFPDVGATWAALGVAVSQDGAVALKDDAPGAAIRRTIMAASGTKAGAPPPASQPGPGGAVAPAAPGTTSPPPR